MSSKQIYPKKKILKENYDTEQKKKKHHRTHKTHVIRGSSSIISIIHYFVPY